MYIYTQHNKFQPRVFGGTYGSLKARRYKRVVLISKFVVSFLFRMKRSSAMDNDPGITINETVTLLDVKTEHCFCHLHRSAILNRTCLYLSI